MAWKSSFGNMIEDFTCPSIYPLLKKYNATDLESMSGDDNYITPSTMKYHDEEDIDYHAYWSKNVFYGTEYYTAW